MWGESRRDSFVVDVLRGEENIAKSGGEELENLSVLQRDPTWTFFYPVRQNYSNSNEK